MVAASELKIGDELDDGRIVVRLSPIQGRNRDKDQFVAVWYEGEGDCCIYYAEEEFELLVQERIEDQVLEALQPIAELEEMVEKISDLGLALAEWSSENVLGDPSLGTLLRPASMASSALYTATQYLRWEIETARKFAGGAGLYVDARRDDDRASSVSLTTRRDDVETTQRASRMTTHDEESGVSTASVRRDRGSDFKNVSEWPHP